MSDEFYVLAPRLAAVELSAEVLRSHLADLAAAGYDVPAGLDGWLKDLQVRTHAEYWRLIGEKRRELKRLPLPEHTGAECPGGCACDSKAWEQQR